MKVLDIIQIRFEGAYFIYLQINLLLGASNETLAITLCNDLARFLGDIDRIGPHPGYQVFSFHSLIFGDSHRGPGLLQ